MTKFQKSSFWNDSGKYEKYVHQYFPTPSKPWNFKDKQYCLTTSYSAYQKYLHYNAFGKKSHFPNIYFVKFSDYRSFSAFSFSIFQFLLHIANLHIICKTYMPFQKWGNSKFHTLTFIQRIQQYLYQEDEHRCNRRQTLRQITTKCEFGLKIILNLFYYHPWLYQNSERLIGFSRENQPLSTRLLFLGDRWNLFCSVGIEFWEEYEFEKTEEFSEWSEKKFFSWKMPHLVMKRGKVENWAGS